MSFYVYALHNKEREKIYIGQTDNIEKRLERHNKLLSSKQTSFTSKMSGEWKLVYSEEYGTRKEAMKREKELKSYRGREFVKTKIKYMRP
jgi:putative endonuclease